MGSPRSSKQAGFTMVELLVSISVIGVIFSIALASTYLTSRSRARDWERKQELRRTQLILQDYYQDYGEYPRANSNGQMSCCGTGSSGTFREWGHAFGPYGSTPYYGNNRYTGYRYRVRSDRQEYQLYTYLESKNDPDAFEYTFVNCGSDKCNFGVSSTGITPKTNPLN